MTSSTAIPLLRLEVARLRSRGPHRRFDTVVHLGRLGGPYLTCAVAATDRPVMDAGTRTEVVETLLEGLQDLREPVSAWLFRSGEPLLQDEDLAWHSATCRALGVHQVRLEGFWTVTRSGWLDVRTGDTRTWKRLRV